VDRGARRVMDHARRGSVRVRSGRGVVPRIGQLGRSTTKRRESSMADGHRGTEHPGAPRSTSLRPVVPAGSTCIRWPNRIRAAARRRTHVGGPHSPTSRGSRSPRRCPKPVTTRCRSPSRRTLRRLPGSGESPCATRSCRSHRPDSDRHARYAGGGAKFGAGIRRTSPDQDAFRHIMTRGRSGGGVGSGSGSGPGSGGGTGGGVYRAGGAVSAPRLIKEVKPGYTSEALIRRFKARWYSKSSSSRRMGIANAYRPFAGRRPR
jgi:hypothetical protein